MAESLCQKRALEAFRLDPAKWGGNVSQFNFVIKSFNLIEILNSIAGG